MMRIMRRIDLIRPTQEERLYDLVKIYKTENQNLIKRPNAMIDYILGS